MSEKNGASQAPVPDAADASMPTLSIKDTLAHGADPTGKECAIVIGSITGQQVRLHFASIEALADFSLGVKGALNQMRNNARKIGDELVTATPASRFSVGHVHGLDGTLLVLDPDMPSESTYVFAYDMAANIGKMLIVESGKQVRIKAAISAGTGGGKVMVPRRKLIKPGEH